MSRRGCDVRVITSRWSAADAPADEADVQRGLHVQWGPPYPPEGLAGLLAVEVADRQLVWRCLDNGSPAVVDIWGMEFASQTLVAALLAGPHAVHLTLEDVWLQRTYLYDPAAMIRQVADMLSVKIPRAIGDLLCLGAGPPDVGSAGVSFVSQALSDQYGRAGWQCPHARVRHAGIDVTRFDCAGPPEPPPFVILYVGQLTASRGPADLIRAAARAAEKVADHADDADLAIRFVGAGSADFIRELTEFAAHYAHARLRFDFTGPVDSADIPRVYRDAHLFVHASRLPEGLPTVLMEAMASGVPVVATDSGGQRDILAGGKWGALIPTGDVEAMSAAICDAILNGERWRQRAVQARQYALRTFDIEHYVDGHLDDLRDAIERRSGSAATETSRDPEAVDQAFGPFRAQLASAAALAAASFDAATDADGAWRLGVVLKRCGALRPARDILERLPRSGRVVDVRRSSFHLAEISLIEQRFSDAEACLGGCLETAGDHRKALYDLEFAKRREVPPHLLGLTC